MSKTVELDEALVAQARKLEEMLLDLKPHELAALDRQRALRRQIAGKRKLGSLPPVGIKEETESASLLKFMMFIMDTKGANPLLRNLSGVDKSRLVDALLQLRDLEMLEPGKKRRDLKEIQGYVENAKRGLIRVFRPSADLHTMTRALEAIAVRMRRDLKPWDEKGGKRGRGHSPQTRILVALMAYFLKKTRNPHYAELSELVTACYRVAGSHRNCSGESLRKLWERNSSLRRNCESVLAAAHKVHAPVLWRKGHAPRSLGSGPGRFESPQASKSRVSASKYLN
jgi:hypothetical protein